MLKHALIFSPSESPSENDTFFQQLPAAAVVFVLRGDGEPYVSKTANLRRRLQRLLGPPVEHSKRLNLRDRVHQVEFTSTGSDFESQFLLYKVLRETFPTTYNKRLRLRPAPLVKLHLANAYPRASVTTRLSKMRFQSDRRAGVSPAQIVPEHTGEDAPVAKFSPQNFYYGPFPSRTAAEKFANDALDFFKMRRCVEDLHPDPAFPGCVYSEMKMCLAPCFKGCTREEHDAEVMRVQNFFESRGESLMRELAEQRDRASAGLAFEEAATLHAKIEKLKPVLAQLPEIVSRIDRLEAIMIQPSAEPHSVALFRFSNAILDGPFTFSVEQSGEPQSMESRLQATIARFPVSADNSTQDRSDQLAILKRWFYRSKRVGEIFFADEKGSWPMRRIVRAIGRVYRGEQAEEAASFAQPPASPALS